MGASIIVTELSLEAAPGCGAVSWSSYGIVSQFGQTETLQCAAAAPDGGQIDKCRLAAMIAAISEGPF